MAACSQEEGPKTKVLTQRNAEILFDNANTFLISIDGVLIDSKGEPIEGSLKTVQDIRSTGKRVFYMSDYNYKTSKEVEAELVELGYPVEEGTVITPTTAAIQYLKMVKFKGKVYVIGQSEVWREEFEEAGYETVFSEAQEDTKDPMPWLNIDLDPKVKCVLVNFDHEINFTKLVEAASYLKNPRCKFLAANSVRTIVSEDGKFVIPDVGTIVAAIKSVTHREPFVMGMPGMAMSRFLRKRRAIRVQKTVVIGSKLNRDILFAKGSHMKSLLLLSGDTKEEEFNSPTANPPAFPTYFGLDLAEFGEHLCY